jgi:hypothetical protein
MKRFLAALATLLFAAACTTTNERAAPVAEGAAPPAAARILVVTPDVQLSLLGMGSAEARADWSQAAQANIAQSIATALRTQGHRPEAIALDPAQEGRSGQILRLHEAVGRSILMYEYQGLSLPSKDTFDWTLGEGAQEIAALAQGSPADYALFFYARGAYSSGGRIALAVIAGAPTGGGQQMFASLVDLRTGDIVWFNVAVAGPGDDMRTPDGAARLVDTVLRTAPL